MNGKGAPYEQLIRDQMEKNKMKLDGTAASGAKAAPILGTSMAASPASAPALDSCSKSDPAPVLKVKVMLVSKCRVSVKPSNKAVSTILAKFPNSVYSPRDNEWTFDAAHYADVASELKKNKVVFEGIPPGTLALCRKHVLDESFVFRGSIYEKLMKFQRDAVVFALNRNGRVLLADDMGLGKTV